MKFALSLADWFMQVRCRSQEELNASTSSEDMRQREATFFRNHDELGSLPNENKGMPALVDKLVKLQGQRIHSHIPVLKKQVSSLAILHGVDAVVNPCSMSPRLKCELTHNWQAWLAQDAMAISVSKICVHCCKWQRIGLPSCLHACLTLWFSEACVCYF